MLRNYFIITWRNLFRQRVYSFINIAGLAVGLACCILLLLYVQHELSYDRHHERLGQIYRVLRETRLDDGSTKVSAGTSGALAAALEQDFPEVQEGVRLLQIWGWVEYEGKGFSQPVCVAGPEILDVFTYSLIKGDPRTALDKPLSVLLTEEAVKLYFGEEDPLGKVLLLNNDIHPLRHRELTVTGVLKDMPQTSTFRFDFLVVPPSDLGGTFWDKWTKDMSWRPVKTFITLPEGYDPTELEHKLPDFMARHMGEQVAASNTYHLQPLSRQHLYSTADYGMAGPGDIVRVQLLSAVALLILVVACANFVNLATARSAHRTREVGVRKAIGAQRRQLVFQFLGESLLLVMVSFVLALALVELVLPEFSALISAELTLGGKQFVRFAPYFLFLVLSVALLAGIYPALYLSAFKPVDVLKGKGKIGAGRGLLRKALVVFQFAVSVLLIICTVAVYYQVDYMSNQKLGFDKEQVISLWIYNKNSRLRSVAETVKNDFLQHPGVLKATVLLGSIPDSYLATIRPQGQAEDVQMYTISGDEDALDVYGIELVAGRNIARPGEFLLNEAAVQRLGWADPIGKELQWIGEEVPSGPVVGVVKNFHFQSFREPIKPFFIAFCPFPQTLTLRLRPENLGETMKFLEEKYREWVGQDIYYRFLDDRIDTLYSNEKRMGRTLSIFGVLALFVACLGLFGLTAFAAELRTKEVGIRKVLGATVSHIVLLMSKEFVALVCLANAVAWPVAWYVVGQWLENFAYRIELGWGFFVLTGGLGVVVALLTVSGQAIRVASANPVDALRHE